MIKIGFTQRTDFISRFNEQRDSIDKRIYSLCFKLNGIPIPIPNFKINIDKIIKNLDIDLLILTGGNSIIHKNKILKDSNFERDNIEKKLIKFYIGKIPILGICRGMQFLNIYYGGSLNKIKNHVSTRHKILFEKKYDLPKIVNSYHNWGIKKNDLSNKLTPIAFDKEQNIEAFINYNKKLLGIMWHPERDKKINIKNIKLINSIIR